MVSDRTARDLGQGFGYTTAYPPDADSFMDLNQIARMSPQVISQEVAGEIVILDLESECYFGLDAVGARIWKMLGDDVALLTIYHNLLTEYDVDAQQLRADLEALIQEISARGLITLDTSQHVAD